MDLTEGKIERKLIAIALPLFAGSILQQLYNTLDAIVVGRFIGEEAFAAVGAAGSVMNLFLFLLSGFTTGISALLAQLYGAGDLKLFRKELFTATVLGTGFTALLGALGLFSLSPVLILLQTPSELIPLVSSYLGIVIIGLMTVFAYDLAAGALRAAGDTRAAVLFLSVSMAVNLVLDILFIAVFRMGVAGAAWATVAAEMLSAVLAFLYLRCRFPELIFSRQDASLDRTLIRQTLYFGSCTGLHMCGLYIGKLFVQAAVNSLGTSAIAAFAAASRIEGFANSIGDSGAAAMALFTGQNTGAGKEERTRKGFHRGLLLLSILSIAASLFLYFSAPFLVPLMVPSAEAVDYLRIIALFYLFNFLGSGFSGYFQGRGKGAISAIGSLGQISLRVILSWVFIAEYGINAIAVASGLGWIAVVLFWALMHCSERKAIAALP